MGDTGHCQIETQAEAGINQRFDVMVTDLYGMMVAKKGSSAMRSSNEMYCCTEV